ncbi:MAG: PQQ-binding-like beta-propeller repeat protein, partial [Candidatus Aminicenantes bacterium]|nr:PQQ-binding-like beta-propeller repeat protein [Candidatus Aminicenantes bacterium]
MKTGTWWRNLLFLFPLLLAANCVPAPDPSDDNDWRYHGKDPGGTRYSALAQINRTNVQELEVAWIYRMGEVKRPHRTIPDRMQAPWETTPLVVDGVLYLSTPSNRVIALEAETGRELWEFDPQEGSGDDRYYLQHRGVSYWEGTVDGKSQRRILMGTGDARLFALDADTGRLIPEFGEDGWVDLDGGMTTRWPKSIYTLTSPVAVYQNVVVTGSRLSSGQQSKGPSGKVRAWDVLTGDLVWEFHTVPRPGEPGNETWEGDSWKDRSGANAWSVISVDTERGWVFVPTASPLGPDRDGQNLYGNSLVVLDALTGKLVWYFQAVRHDTWDYDLPAQPVLVTLEQDGQEIPAVAQPTKMGMVFVLHRETGQPVLPVEERPVPQTGGV